MFYATSKAASLCRPVWRRISLGLTGVLAASAVAAVSAPASLAEPDRRPAVPREKIIPHTDIVPARQPVSVSPGGGGRPATAWPAAGEAEVVLPRDAVPERSRRADLGAQIIGPRRAGDLPVTVSAASGPDSVRVRLADQATARRAGVSGPLLSLTLTGGDAGTTTLGLDYSSFRYAGGADLGSRLRLVRLPACALSTPEVPACQVWTPLPSRNDVAAQVVSAPVPVAAPLVSSRMADTGQAVEATVVAAVADASGPQGTFEASSLSPSGTWSVTGNSGAFAWQYPINLPPAATGSAVAPAVALSYNSSSVDGRTAGTNNQPSWIGQGWDYTPGFVERTYRMCREDEGLPAAQQTPDLCWAGQIVAMHLGGKSIALVYDDATHAWRGAEDNGARIELLTGAANGINQGEHWKVTTTDGVQYWFGRQRGPGYTNQEQTNSAWGVPVYGPRSGDPCYNPAGFAQSSCTQAWRWNLDFVEDPNGNVTSYYYVPETNHYGANNGTTGVAYTRGGTLARIDYGLRKIDGSVYGQTVPGQVVFSVIERCVPDSGFSCDPSLFTAANAQKWPDTPQDQQCLPGAVCNNHGPSFWTTKRLSTITTQYNTGAGPVRVDTYQLTQSFPSIGDPELRLDSLVRTGYGSDGSSIALPPIQFTSQLYDNRVPGFNNQPAMAHWRLTEIAAETGSIIQVTYSQPECGPGNMPTDQANVTKRCFPVNWTLPYHRDPTLDYFHKYVVTQVQVQDRNAISPTQITSYAYLGTPAWHYDDNEIVKPKHRTYGQFRGYAQVEMRTGNATQDQRTLTRTSYFRGMDGDILPAGGSRPATVTNSLGESTADRNTHAGQLYEIQKFNGDGGTQLSTEVTDPTIVTTTATRNRPGLRPLTANVVGTAKTRVVTSLAAGGTRTATTTHRYDTLGRLTATTASGTDLPDVCTTKRYAENTTSGIRDRVSETIVSQQVCPPEGTTPAPILSATRTYYDNSTTLGAVPGAGLATRTDRAAANSGGNLTYATTDRIGYDPAGRATSATDALDRTTRTTYTPTGGGVLSRVVTTNAKTQTATVELEPARGSETAIVDVGGRRTDATYDQLGRLAAVWNPGRAKGQVSPHITFDYLLRNDGPLAVTTRTLVDHGNGTNSVTTISLYDAFGQLRQTQADDVSNPDGVDTRVVKDIFYDTHGWAVRSNNRYTTTGAPATTLVSVADSAVDDRTVTTFDGAGRTIKSTAYRGLTATWDTRTIHGGDRTTTIPPRGGVTATTITDARGRNLELRQYTSSPTVTGSVVSGGTFTAVTYRYNALGKLDRMADAAGNAWTYGYDMLGREVSASDPDSGSRTSTVDLAGQITSTTDARGQTLAHQYDVLGRRTAEYSGSLTGTKLASWTWDTARNGVGLLASSTRHTPSGNYLLGMEYDGAGRIAKQTVRIPAAETGLAGDHTTAYAYTSTGLVRGYTPVSLGGLPGEDVVTEYNRYGIPKRTFGYNVYVDNSTYTPYGEPAQYTLGVNSSTGWLTYDRDPQTRRITQVNLSLQQAWSQVDDLRYQYDPAGNITRITNVQGHPDNGGPTRMQCFGYDPLNRLSEAWTATDNCAAAPSAATVGGPNPYWRSWTFDAVGLRRTQVQHASGGDTTTTYNYPAPGGVRPHALSSTSTTGPAGTSTTGYDYDATGNTTARTLPSGNQTLTWTPNNRLATVTTPAGTTSYVYDADGNQLLRRDPGRTTLYLPGEEIVRDHTAGTVTGTRYYTHRDTVVALRVGGTNISYLQRDQHGTNQVAVKAEAIDGHTVTRRTFDPYGNPIGAAAGIWPDAHGFLDKPHNPDTGLTDIGARKYDSGTGRFISVDPVLDPAHPQQWAAYTYADNNPVTLSDPSGLIPDYCGVDVECYGYSPSNGCPYGCGTEENINWGKGKAVEDILNDPVLDKDRTRKVLPNIRKFGYKGSDDYTWRDALEWANESREGFIFLCINTHEGGLSDLAKAGCYPPSGITIWDIVKGVAEFVYELTPVADAINCASGKESCLWLLTNVGPLKGLKVIDKVADAAKTANKVCSFSGETEVLMSDGTRKPIEDIKVGDQVLATDPETGEHGPRTVTAVWVHQDSVIDLETQDGARVTTTEDHHFYNTTDKAWQAADELDAGDQLWTTSGTAVRVAGLRAETRHAAAAYNLTVQDIHTYYVGAGEMFLLAHNDRCDWNANTILPSGGTVRDVGQRIWGHGLPSADRLAGKTDEQLRGLASLEDARKLRDMYAQAAADIPSNATAPIRVQLAQQVIDAWGR